MGYINLPPSLQSLFAKINERLQKLETARRFTMPSTTTDFSSATGRNGDIWLNTTSNTPKYLDATGAVATFGGGSSAVIPPRVKAGYAYTYLGVDTGGNSFGTAQLNQLNLQPFYLGSTATAKQIAINVFAAAAGGVCRLGIYNNSATEDFPSTLLLDCGAVSTATTGGKTITINQTLTAGLYWLGYLSTTGAPTLSGMSNIAGGGFGGGAIANTTMMPAFTTASFLGQVNALGWAQIGLSAFPATFGGSGLISGSIGSMWLGF